MVFVWEIETLVFSQVHGKHVGTNLSGHVGTWVSPQVLGPPNWSSDFPQTGLLLVNLGIGIFRFSILEIFLFAKYVRTAGAVNNA